MAAVRLVNALNENGVYARLGVLKKSSANPYVFKLPQKKKLINNPKLEKISDKIYIKILNIVFKTTNGIKHTTNFQSKTDVNWINNSEFDLVNLHWISGVICNKDIAKIKKPIVWTMHDSWPCCGAEHHPNVIENDKRWQEGYYKWNKPKSTKGQDLCRKVWNQKKKYLENNNIIFTAPSNWEHDVLKSSKLFGTCECKVIPNIIDHSVFYSKDKKNARALFNIPSDKIVIGFGAAYDIDNYPHAKEYLYQHYEQLSARSYVQKAHRNWYEIWVPQNPDSWKSRKIVFRDISETPQFWLDESGAIVNGDCYWIEINSDVSEDMVYLTLAVVNSRFIEKYYDTKFHTKLYSGKRRFMTQYVEDFPLPSLDNPYAQKAIDVVKQIISGLSSEEESRSIHILNSLVDSMFTVTS